MDSVVLLYRPQANVPWRVHPSSSNAEYLGARLIVFTLLKGDYLLAKGNPPLSYQEAQKRPVVKTTMVGYEDGRLQLRLELPQTQKGCLLLLDEEGTCIYNKQGKWGRAEQLLSIPVAKRGTYFLRLLNSNGRTAFSKKIVF